MPSLSQKYWGKNCQTYIKLLDHTEDFPSPYTQTITPTFLELVKKLSRIGDKVLDIGCGEGYLTRLISSTKRRVSGCDISPEMISAAKNQSSSISYWTQDIEKKDSNRKNLRFKLIVSNLVFTYLKDIDQSLKNTAAYLRSDGYLVIAIPHPCFYHQENYRWFMEEKNETYRIGKYLEEKTFVKEIANGVMTHYIHRTLSSYIRIFIKNNFALVDILEPTPKKISNIVLKKTTEVPNLIFFVLKKHNH